MAFRIDDATAAVAEPVRTAVGTQGYFTEGNPGAGTPATIVTAEWLNMVQKEVEDLATIHGDSLDKADDTQLSQAIAGVRMELPFWETLTADEESTAAGVSAAAMTAGGNPYDMSRRYSETGAGGVFTVDRRIPMRTFGSARAVLGCSWVGSIPVALAAGETFAVVVKVTDAAGATTTIATITYNNASGIVAWGEHTITMASAETLQPGDKLWVDIDGSYNAASGSDVYIAGVHVWCS